MESTRCKRCFQSISMSKVRLDRDGKTYVCTDCLDQKTPSQRMRGLTNESSISTQSQQIKERLNDEPVVSYKCECGYSFERKKSKPVKVCPYCGKNNFSEVTSVSADTLLDHL